MSIEHGDPTPDDADPSGLGGLGGLEGLLQQASQMQERMMSAQAELGHKRVTGDAGGGLVTAEVDGTGELVGLTIKPEACDPDDTETLADLVVAAVRAAATNAQDLARAEMQQATGGLGELGDLFGSDSDGPSDEGGVGFRF